MAYNDLSDNLKSALANSGISAEDYDRETASQNGVEGLQDENKGAGVPQDVQGMESVPEPDIQVSSQPTFDDMKRFAVGGMGDMLPQAVEVPDIYAEDLSSIDWDIYATEGPSAEAPKSVANKPTSKKLKAVSKALNVEPGATNQETIDKNYEKVAPQVKQENINILADQVERGDAPDKIVATTAAIQQEKQPETNLEKQDRTNLFIFDTIVASNPRFNPQKPKFQKEVTPDQAALAKAKAAEDAAGNESMAQLMDTIAEEQEKTKIVSTEVLGRGFLMLFPLAENAESINAARKIKEEVPEMSYFQGRYEDMAKLSEHLKTLSPKEQADVLNRLYKSLSDVTGSKHVAATVIKQVLDPMSQAELEREEVSSWIFTGIDIATLGFIKSLRKGAAGLVNSARDSEALGKFFRTQKNLVKSGGRKIVSDDSARVIAGGESDLGTTVNEAVGHARSTDPNRLYPDGSSSSKVDIQIRLTERSKQMAADANEGLRVGTYTAAEHAEFKKAVSNTYSQHNPHIYHNSPSHKGFDIKQGAGSAEDLYTVTLHLGTHSGASFRSVEDAVTFAKAHNYTNYEVVPLVSNVDHAGRATRITELEALKLEVDAGLSQQMLKTSSAINARAEANYAAASNALPKSALPDFLKSSGNEYVQGGITHKVAFEDDYDKLAYLVEAASRKTAVKQPPTVIARAEKAAEYAAKKYGASKEELILHGGRVRVHIAQRLNDPETIETGVIQVRSRMTEGSSVPYGILIGAHDRSVGAAFGHPAMKTTGNVSVSKSMPDSVTDFVADMNSALGINRKVLVLDMEDAALAGGQISPYIDALKISDERGLFFISDDNIPTILINRAKFGRGEMGNLRLHEELAHQYSNLYRYTFQNEHGETFVRLFNEHLASRNLPGISDLEFADLVRMRSNGAAYEILEDSARYKNFDEYMKEHPWMKDWTTQYNKWFSDNFTRWAFTDAPRKGILSELFKDLGDTIRTIIERVKSMFPAYERFFGTTDDGLSKFLNDHVDRIKVESTKSADDTFEGSKAFMESEQHGINRVSQLEEQRRAISEELAALKASGDELADGYLIRMEHEHEMTLNSRLGYDEKDLNSIIGIKNSLNLTPRSFLPVEAYGDKLLAAKLTRGWNQNLSAPMREAVKGLSKAELSAVEDVLIQGSHEGVRYGNADLYGLGLNKKQIEAYNAFRDTRDALWLIKDQHVAAYMRSEGYRAVEWSKEGVVVHKAYAKDVLDQTLPADRLDAAKAGLRGKKVYDVRTGQHTTLDDAKFAELDSGAITIKQTNEPILVDAIDAAGKTNRIEVTLLVDDVTNVKSQRITGGVYPYRQGEYSRVYEDPYFVRIKGKRDIDGVETDGSIAFMTARSGAQAGKAANDIRKALGHVVVNELDDAARILEPYGIDTQKFFDDVKNGRFGKDLDVVATTEGSKDIFLKDAANMSYGRGGFSESRGSQLYSASLDEKTNIMSPMASLQREIDTVSKTANINTHLDFEAARWFREFYSDLPVEFRTMHPTKAIVEFAERGKIGVGAVGDREKKALEIAKHYLSDAKATTAAQDRVNGLFKMGTENLENLAFEKFGESSRVFKGVTSTGKVVREGDLAGWLRSAASQMKLGLFNFAQVLTQSSTAALIHALHPTHTLSTMRVANALKIWSTDGSKEVLAALGKAAEAEDLPEFVGVLRKNGYIADPGASSLSAQERGLMGKEFKRGVAGKAATNILELGKTPFNFGENYSRVAAHWIAKEQWAKANPGKYAYSKAAITEWSVKADDLMFNMSEANRLNLVSKGYAANVFQFMPFSLNVTQTLLNGVGGVLSGGKMRSILDNKTLGKLVFANTVLFGVANQGPVSMALEAGLSAMPDETRDWYKGLDADARFALEQGFVAGMINYGSILATGKEAKLGIGKSMSILDAVTFPFELAVKVVQGLAKGEFNAFQKFPTIAIAADTAKSVSMLYSLYLPNTESNMTLFDVLLSPEWQAELPVTSLSRRARAEVAARNHNYYFSKQDAPLVKLTDMEVAFARWGLQPQEINEFYNLKESKKEKTDRLKEIASEFTRLYMIEQGAKDAGDTKKAERVAAARQALILDLPTDDMAFVFDQMEKTTSAPAIEKMITDQGNEDFKRKLQGESPDSKFFGGPRTLNESGE